MIRRLLSIMIILFVVAAGNGNYINPHAFAQTEQPIEASYEDVIEIAGNGIAIPETASVIRYSIIPDTHIGEIILLLDEAEYTLRIQSSESFHDISNLQCVWEIQDPVVIGENEGVVLYAFTDNEILSACQWHDPLRNTMYSISSRHDFETVSDVYLAAELIYVSSLSENDPDYADTLIKSSLDSLFQSIIDNDSPNLNAYSLAVYASTQYAPLSNSPLWPQNCIAIFNTMSIESLSAFSSHFIDAMQLLLSAVNIPSEARAIFSSVQSDDSIEQYLNESSYTAWVNFCYTIESALDISFSNDTETP